MTMAAFFSSTARALTEPIAATLPVSKMTLRRLACSSLQKNAITASSPDKAVGGLPRFFVHKLPSVQGLAVSIEGDEFWHMSKVLRLAADDRVELIDGNGGIVEGVLTTISRTSIRIAAAGDIRHLQPVGPFWHVAAAFGSLKGGRGDWLIEKCTELGAKSVIPLLSKRSPNIGEGRSERWTRVVKAAAKQCQRLHSMVVRNPMDLSAVLEQVRLYDIILLADSCSAPLIKVLPKVEMDWNGLLFIGPEGDFTEEEKDLMIRAGALPVGLGPRRLRVETAAISMLSAVTLLGDSQFFIGT